MVYWMCIMWEELSPAVPYLVLTVGQYAPYYYESHDGNIVLKTYLFGKWVLRCPLLIQKMDVQYQNGKSILQYPQPIRGMDLAVTVSYWIIFGGGIHYKFLTFLQTETAHMETFSIGDNILLFPNKLYRYTYFYKSNVLYFSLQIVTLSYVS